MTRRPQLDGVRGLAVLLVVVSHTAGDHFYSLGAHGVTLFFVLSAYLITSILLRERGEPAGRAFRVFYTRRALRIFPAYYLLLAVLLARNVPGLRAMIWWHAAYLSNWHLALTGWWLPAVGHLWTLAIEEQFYLIWPWVVFLVPAKRFGSVCVALATMAVVTRGFLATVTSNWLQVVTPTMGALDPLALGAMLAWSRPRSVRWCLPVGLVLAVLADLTFAFPPTYVGSMALGRFGMALVSVWLIHAGAAGRLPVFAWRPLRSLGTISYGVYLWHQPIAWAMREAYPTLQGGLVQFVAVFGASCAVASLSWIVLERPLNRLKDRVGSLAAPGSADIALAR